MVKSKPTVFISHVHGEQHIANAIEEVIRTCLLGAVSIFNSSNRKSLSPGDPWRETIVDTLKGSASVLVVASPDSVASPWVNFEAGGAWLSGVRVVPCCVKGMKPSSLPAPLGHLQAVSLDTVDGLTNLIRQIAEIAGLDYPSNYDFDAGLKTIVSTWRTIVSDIQNEDLLKWLGEAERRPNKHAGTSATGFFRIKDMKATEPRETKQVTKYKLVAGDSLRCLFRAEGDQIGYREHCFVKGDVADMLEQMAEGVMLRGKVTCMGQMKVYEFNYPSMDFDDERGIEYHAAWLIEDAEKA